MEKEIHTCKSGHSLQECSCSRTQVNKEDNASERKKRCCSFRLFHQGPNPLFAHHLFFYSWTFYGHTMYTPDPIFRHSHFTPSSFEQWQSQHLPGATSVRRRGDGRDGVRKKEGIPAVEISCVAVSQGAMKHVHQIGEMRIQRWNGVSYGAPEVGLQCIIHARMITQLFIALPWI